MIDVGAGVGRHGLELAARGFKVNAFDFADGAVERAQREYALRQDEIAAVDGSFQVERDDARCPRPQETAALVLCLYDVVGSSPVPADAERVFDSLFQLSRPGGVVVLGALNGTQLARALGHTLRKATKEGLKAWSYRVGSAPSISSKVIAIFPRSPCL